MIYLLNSLLTLKKNRGRRKQKVQKNARKQEQETNWNISEVSKRSR